MYRDSIEAVSVGNLVKWVVEQWKEAKKSERRYYIGV
jgi:hypothetical protein